MLANVWKKIRSTSMALSDTLYIDCQRHRKEANQMTKEFSGL